jgi:hypothetical protein
MKNKSRKLVLSQETLKNLTEHETGIVGFGPTISKCSYCCPTFTCVVPGED